MFKAPVKPMWEDENNKNGGRLTNLNNKKSYNNLYNNKFRFI